MKLLARTSGFSHCLVGFTVHVAHGFLWRGHTRSAEVTCLNKGDETIFSDIWMLPPSMPVSNNVTALLSTSRAGIAKFDLGADDTSKHITICDALWQISRRAT
jgi:hypothetical protein